MANSLKKGLTKTFFFPIVKTSCSWGLESERPCLATCVYSTSTVLVLLRGAWLISSSEEIRPVGKKLSSIYSQMLMRENMLITTPMKLASLVALCSTPC
jgi:hypothetical protein